VSFQDKEDVNLSIKFLGHLPTKQGYIFEPFFIYFYQLHWNLSNFIHIILCDLFNSFTFDPWSHVMSGGGTEYKFMMHVNEMVLPAFT